MNSKKKSYVMDSNDTSYLLSSENTKESTKNITLKLKRKQRIIKIGSVFIFLILFFYFTFQSDILLSFHRSQKIEDNMLSYQNISIIFSDNVMNSIQEEYTGNQKREIMGCLLGYITKSDRSKIYHLTDIIYPRIFDASVVHVRSEGCPNDSLVVFHSHPINKCLASTQDLITLDYYKSQNPHTIAIIMCNIDRFSVYT